MKKMTLSLLLLSFSAFTACDDDPKSPADNLEETEDSLDQGDDAKEQDPITGDIEGTWAIYEVQTALAEILGQPLEQEAVSIYLVNVEGQTLNSELCAFSTSDATGMYTSSFLTRYIATSPSFEREVSVLEEDSKFKVSTDTGYTSRGIEFEDIATDSFPENAEDSRIIDEDDDGHPGVTLVVDGTVQGQMFTGQRHKASLNGEFVTNEKITGLTTWKTEQLFLGATGSSMLNNPPEATTHPDPKKSHFTMVKVEDGLDCGGILDKRDSLFL